MIKGSRKLPTHHITIRVPWHDNEWKGVVCKNPDKNISCQVLSNIARNKNEDEELKIINQSFENLSKDQLPPCAKERGAFMAPFAMTHEESHPYVQSQQQLYSHFEPTPFTTPSYSAACVPFNWMFNDNQQLINKYKLNYNSEREPQLGFRTNWIQERENQLVMLDTFFGALEPDQSLCFFYAKDTPLSSSSNRVIIGVGKVTQVSDSVEYKYSKLNQDDLRSVLWERNVSHSIRPNDYDNGFIFPYQELLELADKQGTDPEEYLAFAPEEAFTSYSYASELLGHDHAIASILICMQTINRISQVLDGSWQSINAWLDRELNKLWVLRGPYPGFGSALTALFGDGGNLAAYEIAKEASLDISEGTVDPWPLFEKYMTNPKSMTKSLRELVGDTHIKTWAGMSGERKLLLKLLSRFALSNEQLKRFFEQTSRPLGLSTTEQLKDAELIKNPYLLYECDRDSEDPISIKVIERGIFPPQYIINEHPLPEQTRMTDLVDYRRVRALSVAVLERASAEGHTLLPRDWLIKRVQGFVEVESNCPLNSDILAGIVPSLSPVIKKVELADGEDAYQLDRLAQAKALISKRVNKSVGENSIRHSIAIDWREAVDAEINEECMEDDEDEIRARDEKAEALKELAQSRLSVLLGSAGTGKTTLIKMLCNISAIKHGGILLLAPTGKARVQIENKTGLVGKGMTIAQFLIKFGKRYNPKTGAYRANKSTNRCKDYKTVVIDECSMLTEEQLAAVIDALSQVERLVLVGDPKQLPPIGSGRPFYDIVKRLEPDHIQDLKIARGYAELTIPRRQRGNERADTLLASWFGDSVNPAADRVWELLSSGEKVEEIKFVQWEDEEDLQKQLLDLIIEELQLSGIEDESGFEKTLGGSEFRGQMYFHRTKGNKEVPKSEAWQVISPVRGGDRGVDGINKLIQSTFRKAWMENATRKSKWRKINKPVGRQNIIYGDKVINLINSSKRDVYPKKDSYVANGDVGLVVGHYKKGDKSLRPELKVEFTSQAQHEYTYRLSEFETEEPLELAYALTVHKTQGSEFGTTFVVIPNPCWLLSRELLYTALTRQQNRVILLHQGDIHELKRYSNQVHSEVYKRMTNLFMAPKPVECQVDGKVTFLDERLIHKTKRGDLVRSKSEVIIANELMNQGIEEYEYETLLTLPNGKVYPDFTIVDDDTGKVYYWEHLGLLHDPNYLEQWNKKLKKYENAGVFAYSESTGEGNLIITRDDEAGGIDAQGIAKLISNIFG